MGFYELSQTLTLQELPSASTVWIQSSSPQIAGQEGEPVIDALEIHPTGQRSKPDASQIVRKVAVVVLFHIDFEAQFFPAVMVIPVNCEPALIQWIEPKCGVSGAMKSYVS